jgi:hypothetical protein
MTNNGALLANGSNGPDGGRSGGGGAGGSILLIANAVSGSTGTIFALGGNGGAASPWAGGGGGGGMIAIDYGSDTTSAGFIFSAGTNTIGGLGASVHVAGGAAGVGGSSTASSFGTLILSNVSPGPTVTDVSHTPASPSPSTAVTLSGTATDPVGVTAIDIYLDGTAPVNLVHSCSYGASQFSATCTFDVGALSAGSHTTTIRADNGTLPTNGTEVFVVNATGTTVTLDGNVRLDRLKVGVSTALDISFTLQGTRSGLLTVTFPAGFTSITAPTGGSPCLSNFGTSGQTITATKTACSGTITLTGATVTNPATPGAYLISWINDDPGSATIYITLEDQVNVEAAIDPFITVNVGTQAAATACDGTFAGNGGALAFGSLTPSAVASSDASSVPHICLRMSTNAASGAVVTVKSANAALKSLSSLDQIASASATLTAGVSGYGLCIGSAGNDSGLDVTAPIGSAFTIVSPFNGSCSSSLHQVGALLTGRQNILSTAAPSQNAFARIYVKASISPNTPAHNDYKDTLTFIVTGTY